MLTKHELQALRAGLMDALRELEAERDYNRNEIEKLRAERNALIARCAEFEQGNQRLAAAASKRKTKDDQ